MKVTVLGGNGKTGLEVIEQAIEAGYKVTALVRRADTLTPRKGLTIVVGDATKAKDVMKASEGADSIISTLGSMGGTLMTDAVTAVIAASKTTNVKRFIVMSSFAVRKNQLSGGMKLVAGLVMGKMIKDKSASEELLRKSYLDWTVVYATGLTNGAKGAKVRVVNADETISMKHKIARANVAAWMLEETKNNDYIKADVIISE